jgi:hypothetical protein
MRMEEGEGGEGEVEEAGGVQKGEPGPVGRGQGREFEEEGMRGG